MGKGEGLSPSSKGSPRDPRAPVCSARSPGGLGNRGFLPAHRTQLCQPSPRHLGLVRSGMEETVVRPSVFVVDGQTDIPFTRLGRSRQRQPCSAARLGLGFLLLLLAAGLAIQGWFLLQLHWRLEAMAHPLQVSGTGVLKPVGPLCHCAFLRVHVCVCSGQKTD